MVGRMVQCAVMSDMKIATLVGFVAALGLSGTGTAPNIAAAAPTTCDALASMSLLKATIISAEPIPVGGFTPPGPANANAAAVFKTVPAFCRVTARLTPSADS